MCSGTLSDVLTMKGEKENIPLLASTLSWLVRYEQGVLEQPDFKISSSQMLNILKRHPGVRAHVNLVAVCQAVKGVQRSLRFPTLAH